MSEDLQESSIMSSVLDCVREEVGSDVLGRLEALWISKLKGLDAKRLENEVDALEDEDKEGEEEEEDVVVIADASKPSLPAIPLPARPHNKEKDLCQIDGAADSSDEEIEDEDDDDDDEDEDDEDDDEDEEDAMEDEDPDEGGGVEEEPLGSNDDISEEDPSDLFDTDNVVVCQYDKITRARNKWKFHLKDGIMHLNGKDYVFQRANGDAEW
eukprot:TRINITY_DN891_c0_g1_i1.p1 TRINITY_DN891_c0_g1~~TRINITY_DN891_c0_g1_i1.p1  ORF type:complete len:212 (-),score=104.41 TRINITY_DN891_c0_g1_i1:671-1306(-)